MRLAHFILLAIVLCVGLVHAGHIRHQKRATSGEDSDEMNALANVDDNKVEDDDDDMDSAEPPQQLPIASIKSRAIAMDRALCAKLSRYHPHYPRCQEYCDKLNHWIGMCRRDSCHCYS